jgi:hypothetical protein
VRRFRNDERRIIDCSTVWRFRNDERRIIDCSAVRRFCVRDDLVASD